MRLLICGILLATFALGQQMVSMRTSGDTAILTIRVNPGNFITISGAPYSGKRVTTGVQIRTSGLRVPENRTVLFYRDSAGRNRTEMPVSIPGSPVMVTIMDPTLGCEYVLSPGDKTAHKLVGVQVSTASLAEMRRNGAREQADEVQSGETISGGARMRRENLGTRTMQGLEVHGTRETSTWPAGTLNNNDHEIVTTFESWSSPLLDIVVSSKTSRPELTEEYLVSDVKPGDPEASLFAPPADYRVVEESSDFQILIPQTAASTVTKLSSHGPGPAPVSGAPFSGVRTVIAVQMLPDGTREEHPERTAFLTWRDGQGRVRTEWPGQGNVPEAVEIQDPVAGFTYSLDYAAKVARRTAFTQPAAETGLAGNPQPLGSQMISGVPASGIRTTTVGAAGRSSSTGKPVTTEIETWTAGKEGVTLLQKNRNSDGDQATITMKHFSTLEPDPALFRIPATYRVVDEFGSEIAAATARPPAAQSPDEARPARSASRANPQESVFTFRSPPNMTMPATTRAPYSVQSTSQTVFTLPGMPAQASATTTTTSRDSMGRTRTERPQGGFASVPGRGAAQQQQIILPEIDDPVAGYRYILDPVHQIAHRTVVPTRRINPAQAGPVAVPATPPTSQTMPNGMTFTTENLGTQTIDGVMAVGMRTTQTSPGGALPGNASPGNTMPINVVTESWSSIQYGAILKSTSTSSNSTTTTTAKGFGAAEPDPALFQAPPDYKIVDEDGEFSITIARPAQ